MSSTSSLKRPKTGESTVKKRVNFDDVPKTHDDSCDEYSDDVFDSDSDSRKSSTGRTSVTSENVDCDSESGFRDTDSLVDTIQLNDDDKGDRVRSKSAVGVGDDVDGEMEEGDGDNERVRSEHCKSAPALVSNRSSKYNTLVTGEEDDDDDIYLDEEDIADVSEYGSGDEDIEIEEGGKGKKKGTKKKKVVRKASQKTLPSQKSSSSLKPPAPGQKGKNTKKNVKSASPGSTSSSSGNTWKKTGKMLTKKKTMKKIQLDTVDPADDEEKEEDIDANEEGELGDETINENEIENTNGEDVDNAEEELDDKDGDSSQVDEEEGVTQTKNKKKVLKRGASRKKLLPKKSGDKKSEGKKSIKKIKRKPSSNKLLSFSDVAAGVMEDEYDEDNEDDEELMVDEEAEEDGLKEYERQSEEKQDESQITKATKKILISRKESSLSKSPKQKLAKKASTISVTSKGKGNDIKVGSKTKGREDVISPQASDRGVNKKTIDKGRLSSTSSLSSLTEQNMNDEDNAGVAEDGPQNHKITVMEQASTSGIVKSSDEQVTRSENVAIKSVARRSLQRKSSSNTSLLSLNSSKPEKGSSPKPKERSPSATGSNASLRSIPSKTPETVEVNKKKNTISSKPSTASLISVDSQQDVRSPRKTKPPTTQTTPTNVNISPRSQEDKSQIKLTAKTTTRVTRVIDKNDDKPDAPKNGSPRRETESPLSRNARSFSKTNAQKPEKARPISPQIGEGNTMVKTATTESSSSSNKYAEASLPGNGDSENIVTGIDDEKSMSPRIESVSSSRSGTPASDHSNRPTPDTVSLSSVSSVSSVSGTLHDIRTMLTTLQQQTSTEDLKLNSAELERFRQQFKAASRAMKKCEKVSSNISVTMIDVREQLVNMKTDILAALDRPQSPSSSESQPIKQQRSVLMKTMRDLNDTIKVATKVETVSLGAALDADDAINAGQILSRDIGGEIVDNKSNEGDNSSTATSDLYNVQPPLRRKISLGLLPSRDSPLLLISPDARPTPPTPPVTKPAPAIPQPPRTPSRSNSKLSSSSISEESFGSGETGNSYSTWRQYTCQAGEDTSTLCHIKLNTSTAHVDGFTCDVIDVNEVTTITQDYENLISRVMRICAVNFSAIYHHSMISQIVFLVTIPYKDTPMLPWQRVVVKTTNGKEWTELESAHVKDKPDDESRVSVELTKFPVTLAVVYSPMEETTKVDADSSIVMSSADSLTTVRFPANVPIGENTVTTKVIPVTSQGLLYFRSYDEDHQGILCVSPLLTINFERDLRLPVVVALPLIFPRTRRKQSISAIVNSDDVGADGEFYLYRLSIRGEWQLLKYVKIIPREQDGSLVATFDWLENNAVLCVAQSKRGQSRQSLEALVTDFIQYTKKKLVEIRLLQDSDNLEYLTVSVRPTMFIEQPVRPRRNAVVLKVQTKRVLVEEGQILEVKFRGNMAISGEKQVLTFRYYSLEEVVPEIPVITEVCDRYAQRSLSVYCGFLQVTSYHTQNLKSAVAAPPNRRGTTVTTKQTRAGPYTVAEFRIEFPKCSIPPLQPLVRVPVVINFDECLTSPLLHNISTRINEWLKLAAMLNLSKARIQSIIRNNKDKNQADMVYEVLTSWIKRIPVCDDKACVLADVLIQCGYRDIGEEIRRIDRRTKLEHVRIATDKTVTKVITMVCHSNDVINNWQTLGLELGLSHDDITTITTQNDDVTVGRESNALLCKTMLDSWFGKYRGTRPVMTLASAIRHIGCLLIADNLEQMSNKL